MTKIVVIGTGGLAADITAFFEGTSLKQHDNISIKGYIDYDYNIEKYWKRYSFDKPVLGDIDSYEISEDEYFVVGVGDTKFRKYVIDKIIAKGGKFINLIHPTALLPWNYDIGKGNIIGPSCSVGPNSKIGDFNIILAHSIVSHDCVVGNNNFLSATFLCGHVKVENDNYFGVQSTVIPRVVIGSRNTIQAGMVVHNDIAEDTMVFYRFKEKIMAIPRDNGIEQ